MSLAEIFTNVNNLVKKTFGRLGRNYLGSDEFQQDLQNLLLLMKNNHPNVLSTNDLKIQLQTLKTQTWFLTNTEEIIEAWNETNKQLLQELEQL